jgi:hypothetical protein
MNTLLEGNSRMEYYTDLALVFRRSAVAKTSFTGLSQTWTPGLLEAIKTQLCRNYFEGRRQSG